MRSRWTTPLLAVAAAAAAGALAAPLGAQEWQQVTSFRQHSDERALDVKVRYGAGRLEIRPGSGAELYRVAIRYDADMFQPITRYRSGELEVGVESARRGVRLRNNEGGDMTLSLSRDVPLDLDLDFGAVEADLDLGGMRIRRVDIETGASETHVRFSRPNEEACDRLELSMGAASFEAVGLGNANCAVVDVEGGVGEIRLAFDGSWRRDMSADISVALGSVTLEVPEDVGVRVDRDTFLSGFDAARFEKRDGVYYSRNWESATRRLTVRVEGAFGNINLRWGRPIAADSP